MALELLSPAGSPEALRAAVQSGCGAVYLGWGDFNARRSAKNFSDEEFADAIRYCHLRGVRVFLTLNTLLTDRELPQASKEVLLVLDGSTGQNAFEQAKQFTAATEVTGMAITKLDGSAKGGVVIGVSHQFNIPVRYIGLGEGMEDLQPFDRKEFVDSLFKD